MASLQCPYRPPQVLQMRLHVYVLSKHHPHVSEVETAKENTGLGIGNKGGQVLRFRLYGHSLGFVSCHLPAHRGAKHRKDRDSAVAEIMRGARVGYKQLDVASQCTHVFWMGDLNYRINITDLPGYLDYFPGPEAGGGQEGTLGPAGHAQQWAAVKELVCAPPSGV